MTKFRAPIVALLLMAQDSRLVVKSQDVIFQVDAPQGTQFRGVFEMGGYVYASANNYLMKYTLDGDLVIKKDVGEGNNLGQIAALSDDTIVVNPGFVTANDGIQAFQTGDLSRIWNNTVLGPRGAAQTCVPLVIGLLNSTDSTVVSGFDPLTTTRDIATVAKADGSTVWTGAPSRPCGALHPHFDILYVSSLRSTTDPRIIAYNSTTGAQLDATPIGEIPGNSGLAAGVAISSSGHFLYISVAQGVIRFDAFNLTRSSTTLTTNRKVIAAHQNPILLGRMYVSNGQNFIYALDIDDSGNRATELWGAGSLTLTQATFSLFSNDNAILAPKGESVVALDAASGAELWSVPLNAAFAKVLYINEAKNRAYIGSDKLLSIQIGSGTTSPVPTISALPSSSPSLNPTGSPSRSQEPSAPPTVSLQPSASPSTYPSAPPSKSENPSGNPSASPSMAPSNDPTSDSCVHKKSNNSVLFLMSAIFVAITNLG